MNTDSDPHRPIFIISSPRSGSTLLRLLLNTHSKIAIPPPGFMFPFFYPFMYSYGDLQRDENFHALVEDVLEHQRIKGWPDPIEPDEILAAEPDRSFAGLYQTIHEIWGRRRGKYRWGEKTPRNSFWIGEILECFPTSQFLHILRDGRDVAVDWVENLDWPKNVYSTGLEWEEHIHAIQPWKDSLPEDQFLEVRYEDLVGSPPEVLGQICEFLGEAYEPDMLRYYASDEAQNWSESEGCHRMVSRPITDDYVGAHRKVLTLRDRQMLATAIGPTLVDCGYELDVAGRDISEQERRDYIRDSLTDTVETMKWNIWHYGRRNQRRESGIWSDSDATRAFG
jgi:hypothetical protein